MLCAQWMIWKKPTKFMINSSSKYGLVDCNNHEKILGCVSLDVEKVVNFFLAEEKWCPQMEEIYEK